MGIPLQGDGLVLTDGGDEHRVGHDRLAVLTEAFTVLLDALLVGDIRTTDVLTDLRGLEGELGASCPGSISCITDRLAAPNLGTVVAEDLRDLGPILEGGTANLHNSAVLSHEEVESGLKGAFTPGGLLTVGINALTVFIQRDNLAVQHMIILGTTLGGASSSALFEN